MAAHDIYAHSPSVSGRISPRIHSGNPITPVHSPHHSVTSSVSSRTPIHTLTIHEYRRQQNTPVAEKAAPTGKTLRRKPAAPTLSDVDRTPSVPQARPRFDSGSSLRPLKVSQSAQQLHGQKSLAQNESLSDPAFRSQSAEPRAQGGSISSVSTTTSGRLRHFNTRKRLPRPGTATGPGSRPVHFAIEDPPQASRSALSPLLSWSTDNFSPSAQTTPTPSTFSFSRFPQPPQNIDHRLSGPEDATESSRIDQPTYPTTAPATPPATPAIIHYRGASFDLVNPHDSLLLHDIVTPSREFDSSDYLPLRSSDEPLHLSREMAPKRPLYSNLNSAHANILRRTDNSFGSSNLDLPLPPTPTAVSPNSSSYTSPFYSPDSIDAPLPLDVRKASNPSRFSLKDFTRTLSKRLGRNSEAEYGEELGDLHHHNASYASITTEEDYSLPLEYSFVAAPEASYSPLSPTSPATPISPMYSPGFGVLPVGDAEVQQPRRNRSNHFDSEQLTSMVPDEPSTQVGRMGNVQSLAFSDNRSSRPYYDDIRSIYATSSIYTGDDYRKSTYQQSLRSGTQSNPFPRLSGVDASGLANEYSGENLYAYGGTNNTGRQVSNAPAIASSYVPTSSQDAKTDTISKLIDDYNPDGPDQSTTEAVDTVADSFAPHLRQHRPQPERTTSGLSQFEFDVNPDTTDSHNLDSSSMTEEGQTGRPAFVHDMGPPPRESAPLAPAFEYDERSLEFPRVDTSALFSHGSSYSYGDTRNLLQMPFSDAHLTSAPPLTLEPSSSYSQPEAKKLELSSSYSQEEAMPSPHIPQEALEHAEQIFDEARAQESDVDIPAIWIRRSSGSQLFSKKLPDRSSTGIEAANSMGTMDEASFSADRADWETIGRPSGEVLESMGSIADYSSDEESEVHSGLDSRGTLPSWDEHSRNLSHYSHPSPLRSHSHPFSSSPPNLTGHSGLPTVPESHTPVPSRYSEAEPMPTFRFATREDDIPDRGAPKEPYAFAPWAEPYALSDKETQELLASGPNDNIIVNDGPLSPHLGSNAERDFAGHEPSSSQLSVFESPTGPQRENSFDKFSLVGPKGNLTGTPRGTGMHEVGSSVADNSSPGIGLSSSADRRSFRSDYPGFYATPFTAIESVTRIDHSKPTPRRDRKKPPPLDTTNASPAAMSSSPPMSTQRHSFRDSTSFRREPKRNSVRAAVQGQTKLREMVLSPGARRTMSSQDTHFSRIVDGSGRPSTSDTHTPLRPTHPGISIVLPKSRNIIAHEDSPHLLCLERQLNAGDEVKRQKLSWIILAAFCLLPPCIILFRCWGDHIISYLTEGKIAHCTPPSKRAALIGGIVVNIGVVTAIVVPIVVLHAMKAV